uniref:Uncharacterized protein n=1 Tax=Sphaerodactylus townsendi TaxID=933632 RepID=A0ACB8EDT7_9SAUR
MSCRGWKILPPNPTRLLVQLPGILQGCQLLTLLFHDSKKKKSNRHSVSDSASLPPCRLPTCPGTVLETAIRQQEIAAAILSLPESSRIGRTTSGLRPSNPERIISSDNLVLPEAKSVTRHTSHEWTECCS